MNPANILMFIRPLIDSITLFRNVRAILFGTFNQSLSIMRFAYHTFTILILTCVLDSTRPFDRFYSTLNDDGPPIQKDPILANSNLIDACNVELPISRTPSPTLLVITLPSPTLLAKKKT